MPMLQSVADSAVDEREGKGGPQDPRDPNTAASELFHGEDSAKNVDSIDDWIAAGAVADWLYSREKFETFKNKLAPECHALELGSD